VGKGFETVTGDPTSSEGADVEWWDAHGRFWSCGRRLCPACSERIRRRARRQLYASLEKHRQRVGYSMRFVTLTQPALAVSLLETMRILRRAWTLMYKRDFWKQHVQGGGLGIEFEMVDGRDDMYHTHLHILVSSRFIPIELLIEEWETCVTKAHSETEAAAVDRCKKCGRTRGEHRSVPGVGSTHAFRLNASVSVRLVKSKQGSSNNISMKDAIKEVIKYITSYQTWMNMPDTTLLECATVERWPRMFELFGSLKKASAGAASDTIVHTKAITHGGMREPGDEEDPPPKKRGLGLRSLLSKMTLEQIREELVKRIKSAAWFRLRQMKNLYPYVKMFRLEDYLFAGGLKEAILRRAC
jgi:hypothetical protein